MTVSVDIETALYELLGKKGYSASAHAIPASLGEDLPHIHVTRTGGFTTDRVLENNSVDFDVYALTEADAMETASELCGWIRDLEGETVETTCYASEVTSLPYHNPDPRHPNLPRTTIKAQILVRNKEV